MASSLRLCAAKGIAVGVMLQAPPLSAQEDGEQTVVVHGKRAPQAAAEPEVSVGVVQGEPLREPGADAADVLARSPGVQVSRTGTSADLVTVSIRGADGSQVPVYLAGIRLNDDVVGVADLSRIPLWMLYRAQVYRGASPLHTGRSGLGGTIVLEPSRPDEAGYRVGALGGSFGAGSLWFGATVNHLSDDPRSRWVTTVSAKRGGARNDFEFRSDDGTAFRGVDDETQIRQNADYVEDDVWLMTRGQLPAGSTNASIFGLYNHFTREQGVSGLSLLPALAARSSLTRDLVGLSARLPCRWGESCRLSLSSSLNAARQLTTDPAGELSLGASEVDQRNQRVSQSVDMLVDPSEQFQLGVGGLFETSRIQIDAPNSTLARATERYASTQAQVKFSPRFDRFVRGSLRGSCVDASGVEASFGPEGGGASDWSQCQPEGRLGAYHSWVDWGRARVTVEWAARYPTLGERFGVSATTRGNADLDVERATSIDVGGTWEPRRAKWGSYFVDVALFDRTSRNLVAYQRSALGYVRPFNVGQARFTGAEVSGELTAGRHIRQSSSVSLLQPRDVTEGRTTENDLIPFRSQITATEEFEVYRRSPTETVSHLGLIGYATYRSGRVADPAGLIVIPQQIIVDVAARVQFLKQVDVRARVDNLLGSNRYDTIGFPLPGRSFFLSAEIANH